MDQAQHFTGTASAAARSGGDEVGAEFRSGLDAAERECESCSIALLSIMMVTVTFLLQIMVLFLSRHLHWDAKWFGFAALDPGIACMWWTWGVDDCSIRVLYGQHSVRDRSGELQTGQGVVRIRRQGPLIRHASRQTRDSFRVWLRRGTVMVMYM
jgi:hypothetical protein